MLYSNYNAFYNPNAASSTVNYAVGVVGATQGSSTFGSNDLSNTNPLFATPPTSFPFNEEDIKSGAVTVQQVLNTYRSGYTLTTGSPLIGAGDPSDSVNRDIGAVQTH
jgi:hypothetical protein